MSRRKDRELSPTLTRRPGVRTKIYVRNDMIGAGKVDLLRAIDDKGSISAAARSMGIGYRRAWFLIDTIQRCFAAPLLETRRGGAGPGGADLTPLGHELIRRYDAHTEVVNAASEAFLEWLEAHQATEESAPAEGG